MSGADQAIMERALNTDLSTGTMVGRFLWTPPPAAGQLYKVRFGVKDAVTLLKSLQEVTITVVQR